MSNEMLKFVKTSVAEMIDSDEQELLISLPTLRKVLEEWETNVDDLRRTRLELDNRDWRPVTPGWPPYGEVVLGRTGSASPLLLLKRYDPSKFDGVEWVDNDGTLFREGEILECKQV